ARVEHLARAVLAERTAQAEPVHLAQVVPIERITQAIRPARVVRIVPARHSARAAHLARAVLDEQTAQAGHPVHLVQVVPIERITQAMRLTRIERTIPAEQNISKEKKDIGTTAI
ncbi:hypothetical protein, partial [Parageobacillus thermoglucosidasius]